MKATTIAAEMILTRAVEGIPEEATQEVLVRRPPVPGAVPLEVASVMTFVTAAKMDRMSRTAVVHDGASPAIV